jgi:hypothetical protein
MASGHLTEVAYEKAHTASSSVGVFVFVLIGLGGVSKETIR